MKSLLLLGALVLLCGCEDTFFETQPGTNVAACDARFVGQWRLLPAKDNGSKDELFVIVEPACKRWRFIEDGKDDTKTENSVHLAFARVGELALLTLKEDQTVSHDPQARWSDGYRYLRYEFVDGTIRLHPVDDKRVAHLIIDGLVQGRTERIWHTSERTAQIRSGSPSAQREELHNFVSGDRDEMARVALLDGIFQANGYYTLKPATTAEIFKPATNSPANSKP